MKHEIKKRELRNLKTSWLEYGSKEDPILLLLHGYPDTPDAWEYQIEFFSDRFHIICPYVRGALPSSRGEGLSRYTPESIALDFLQILETVDPEHKRKVTVIGHDFGGAHAWTLAPLLGKRLERLVIINALSLPQLLNRWKRPKQFLKSWYVYPMLLPYLPEFLTSHFSKELLNLAYSIGKLPKEMRPTPENPERHIVEPINQYRSFILEALKGNGTRFTQIHCPTLILWGKKDAFLLPPTVEEIEPFTSELTMRILDGNHWIHREKSREVNHLIEKFMDKENVAHAS